MRSDSGFLNCRRVVTLDPSIQGDAIRWEHGRILEVGPAADVARRVPAGTPVYELPDTIVTPGIIDGHTHFVMWALARRRVQLQGARSRDEAVRRVAAARPSQGWVLGQGWDANDWEEAPDRGALDAVQPGPVFLDSLDVHAAWVNSAALAAAGVDRATPDPFGGRIVRDVAGEATGLLLDRAVELVSSILPEPPEEMVVEAVREAQAEAHRLGVTGIHDVEGRIALRAFERLDAAGELRLRVLFHAPVADLPELVARGVRSGTGGEWLSRGGVKMFLDGSLGSRTAWMLDPYTGTADRGLPLASYNDARRAMWTAADAGISVTVHAIGDAAVRRAIDLTVELPQVALPHRIEHFQCVHPVDLARPAAAGIVVSMQPAHLLVDIPYVERHWGERGRGAYAFRSLLRSGATVVFGSDVPVASIDPREGIFAALERRGVDGLPAAGWYPEERIGFEATLGAYTRAAAVAGGVAHRRGTLAPGMDADLVAWRVDPAVERDDGEAMRHGLAVLTVVGGEVVMAQ
jgi:predicted amidohydrolase YtcJ